MRRSVGFKKIHVEWLDKEVKLTGKSLASILRRLVEKEIEKEKK